MADIFKIQYAAVRKFVKPFHSCSIKNSQGICKLHRLVAFIEFILNIFLNLCSKDLKKKKKKEKEKIKIQLIIENLALS